MALAGVKVSFLEAAIAIVAPVDGWRPSRTGLIPEKLSDYDRFPSAAA